MKDLMSIDWPFSEYRNGIEHEHEHRDAEHEHEHHQNSCSSAWFTFRGDFRSGHSRQK